MISSVLLCGFDQGPIHIPWTIHKSKLLFQTTVRNLEEIKAKIDNSETATDTNGEEGVLNIVHPIVNPDIKPDFEATSNLDKIHKRVVEFFPTVELFKDVSDDDDVISNEQIYYI